MQQLYLFLIVLLFYISAFGQNSSIRIQGWTLLSNDSASTMEVLQSAKDYNINQLQLSNEILMDLQEIRNPVKRNLILHLVESAHKAGIKEVAVWDHTLDSIKHYPKKFRTGPDSTINLDNPAFWEWFRKDYKNLLDSLPGVNGVVLRYFETAGLIEKQFSAKLKDKAKKQSYLVDQIAEVVIKEKGMKLYLRTFAATPALADSILKTIQQIKNQEVILMMKDAPHNFFLSHPNDKWIGGLSRPVIIDFDAANEYNGQGIVANTFPEYFLRRWSAYINKKNVIGYSARVDHFGNTKVIGRSSEILLYALKRYTEDSTITSDNIYDEFITNKYSLLSLPYLKPAFQSSYDVISSTFYTLGSPSSVWSELSIDHPANFNLHASGKWIDSAMVFVGHNVNKKLHCWKDVMNHLTPVHFKTKEFYKDIPYVMEKGWITAGDSMNLEYLNYILQEKDYGVNLAEKSVSEIMKAKPYLKDESYKDLFHTFNRTLLTARLHRASAKAYYGYRVYAKDSLNRTPELQKIISNGLRELKETARSIKTYPVPGPSGHWIWTKDADIAMDYYNKIAVTGWPEYGNVVVPTSSK